MRNSVAVRAVEFLGADASDPRVLARVEVTMIKEIQKSCKVPPKIARDVAHAFYSADKDESGSLSQEEFKTILNMEGKGLASEDVWNSFLSKLRNSPRTRFGYEVDMVDFAKWYLKELPDIPLDEDREEHRKRRIAVVEKKKNRGTMRDTHVNGTRDELATALFQAIDTNGNQLIENNEIVEAHEVLVKHLPFDIVELWNEGASMRKHLANKGSVGKKGAVNMQDWLYLMKGLEQSIGVREMKKALSNACKTLDGEET
jgi:Ca2+-binding EF-hand superfamily protein